MTEIRCRVELRQDTDDRRGPGRLSGRLLRYGERAADRPELFEAGALRWPDEGIVLRRQHARAQPIMRVVPELREGGREVWIDALIPDTAAGRDAAVEVRNGTLKGLSVEFVAKRERRQSGIRRIQLADLAGAGLVDDPSYQSSTVEARNKRERRRVWVYRSRLSSWPRRST